MQPVWRMRPVLEQELQSELDAAGIPRRTDGACTGGRDIGVRVSKSRRIGGIERLSAELEPKTFLYSKGLGEGEV